MATVLLLMQCVPENKTKINIPLEAIDFRKPTIQNRWQDVDERNIDSLQGRLYHVEPSSRLLALKGLFTIKDSVLIDSAATLLQDPFTEIREATAFALGQSGFPSVVVPLTKAFVNNDSLAEKSLLNMLILESLGKTGDAAVEKKIASVTTYLPDDHALVEGQIRALYQFALRGITSDQAVERAMDILRDTLYTKISRLLASNYLGRSAKLDLKSYDENLREIGFSDPNPYIRMSIATSFKHIQSDFGYQSLVDWLASEKDERVRANIYRSLLKLTDRDLTDILFKGLNDPNFHVQNLVSQALVSRMTRKDAVRIRRRARSMSDKQWALKANLYTAANRHMSNRYRISKVNMNNEIEALYKKSKSPYAKSAYIKAWSQYAGNIDKLIEEYKSTNNEVVKSAILENLFETTSQESINRVYYGMQRTARRKIRDLVVEAVSSGNASAVALCCDAINEDYDQWRPYLRDLEFVKTGMDKLSLPRDFESHLSAYRLLNMDNDSITVEEIKPAFNHPIDWTVVIELADTVRIRVETDKGSFLCHLYPQVAPSAVSNFVQLVSSGFYKGKAFHRVVPNFVIQTGCPIGNGYGSLDYTIRSEFSTLRYDKEGMIGMASVGADTESTQWFVTHSPTPHLDGRYTLFGEVVEGMEVVHKIGVGDTIKDIKLLN